MTALDQPILAPDRAEAAPDDRRAHAHAHRLPFLARCVFATDHKTVGVQFLFMGLLFLVFGGLLALLVRWQLGWPSNAQLGLAGRAVPLIGSWMGWDRGMVPARFYNVAFSMHATLMIFFAIIPLVVGFIGNYVVPLQIGARDMRFPFLNGLSFWAGLPPGAVMLASFMLAGTPEAGWTSYPPLSALVETGTAWPPAAVCLVAAAWFCCFAFVAYHAVPLRNRFLHAAAVVACAALGAVVLTRVSQRIAFDGQAAWFFSLLLLGFASLLGVVNYITTIVTMRCPGMTFFRLTLTTWAVLITSVLVLFATPVLAAALTLNLLDHHRLTSFFLPANWITSVVEPRQAGAAGWAPGGGLPLLHQHLFWFYSHPAVYIMILPAMGVVSDVLSTFSRKPVFGYRPMVYATGAIAFLGFVVWAHHMFQSGMNPALGTAFALSTMLIAVPSAIKTFNWLGTLWRGSIRFTVPLLFAAGFVSMFVIGGLSGIFMASTAVDVHVHDTYFIVAHIHYVLFGGSVLGVLAGIYYWYPKIFGRTMSHRLGVAHFVLTFVTMNAVFFPMHMLGLHGMPRRVHDYTLYEMYAKFVPLNRFMSYAAIALGLSQLLVIVNFFGSMVWGRRATANPWESNTLEWQTSSPPPHHNFDVIPVVHHGPYEYSSPLVAEDYLPQNRAV